MSYQKIGHPREQFLRYFLQSVFIPHKHRGRVLSAEVTEGHSLRHTLAVSHMIITGDHKAMLRQISGKGFVSLEVLRHTVYDLHHSPYRNTLIGQVPDRMQLGFTVS